MQRSGGEDRSVWEISTEPTLPLTPLLEYHSWAFLSPVAPCCQTGHQSTPTRTGITEHAADAGDGTGTDASQTRNRRDSDEFCSALDGERH